MCHDCHGKGLIQRGGRFVLCPCKPTTGVKAPAPPGDPNQPVTAFGKTQRRGGGSYFRARRPGGEGE